MTETTDNSALLSAEELTRGYAESMNAVRQLNNFLRPLQTFPKLVERTETTITLLREIEQRVGKLREEEKLLRSQVDNYRFMQSAAEEKARKQSEAAINAEQSRLSGLQDRIDALSKTEADMRVTIQGLQAQRDEITATVEKLSRVLKP